LALTPTSLIPEQGGRERGREKIKDNINCTMTVLLELEILDVSE